MKGVFLVNEATWWPDRFVPGARTCVTEQLEVDSVMRCGATGSG